MTIHTSQSSPPLQGRQRSPRDTYLQSLLQTAQAHLPSELALPDLRAQASAMVQEHTFPSRKQEAWRFTDLTPMLSLPFQAGSGPDRVEAEALTAVQVPEAMAQLVLVNGRLDRQLSQWDGVPSGLVIGSLSELLAGPLGQPLRARLAQAARGHEVFTALNTAGFQDAAVVWVPPHQVIERPIQVVSLTVARSQPTLTLPRCLVVAETGSALTFVETFWGTGSHDHFTNSVTELWVDDAAEVTHVRLQQDGQGTFHIGKTAVTQGRDSRYTGITVDLGARLARHHLEIDQAGPQTDTRLYGLSAIAAQQLADTHSLIALHHPHGTADQLHKCIVDGEAHSVFNGKIWVPQAAQLTSASQLNRNLLLSKKAQVDTKPELDIVADNVNCAHGATVSQLDDSQVFYLQSRGISAAVAQQLLVYGFAMEIIERIPVTSLHTPLIDQVTRRSPSLF